MGGVGRAGSPSDAPTGFAYRAATLGGGRWLYVFPGKKKRGVYSRDCRDTMGAFFGPPMGV